MSAGPDPPLVFSRGQAVDLSTIARSRAFECMQVVGGEEKPRRLVVSPHSIFSFEPMSVSDSPAAAIRAENGKGAARRRVRVHAPGPPRGTGPFKA